MARDGFAVRTVYRALLLHYFGADWGDFYTRRIEDKAVDEHHISLENYAKKLGVMKDSELMPDLQDGPPPLVIFSND